MAALAFVISSESSDENVGSPPSRVILFGATLAVISAIHVISSETLVVSPVALVVKATIVAPPIGLRDLIPYSDSDLDSPDDMASPEYISPLPATSLFLCIDSSETSDPSDGLLSQDPYVVVVARWRSKVASCPSLSSEFPIAPVTAPPGIRRRPAILIRPGEVIPFGRPYRTHPNRPRNLLTARKRVGPIPARRLIWRHVSPRSSDHRSSYLNSSSDSSPVHSLSFDTPGQAYYGPSIIDASPRFIYPPVRAPQHSEAFLQWRAGPLSTFYPLTTSESSLGDSSSERSLYLFAHSAGPSCMRCRTPADLVPSSTIVLGSLAPTHDDLLLPRKRFRDSYSSEASMEEDTELGIAEAEVGMELGIGDGIDSGDYVKINPRNVKEDIEEFEAETSAGYTVELGIDPVSAPIVDEKIIEPAGEHSSGSSGTRDCIVRSFKDMPIELDDDVRGIYHHMSEVCIDRIIEIETVQRQLKAGQLIASRERASMVERIESLRLENLKVGAFLGIKRDQVDSIRLHVSHSQEEFCQIRRDRDEVRRRFTRLESFVERRLGF
ncbi:hypothetical protein Tco_0694211 [Tanacetum coccineum]